MGADVTVELSIEDERWAQIDLPTIARRACQSAVDGESAQFSSLVACGSFSFSPQVAQLSSGPYGSLVSLNVAS